MQLLETDSSSCCEKYSWPFLAVEQVLLLMFHFVSAKRPTSTSYGTRFQQSQNLIKLHLGPSSLSSTHIT